MKPRIFAALFSFLVIVSTVRAQEVIPLEEVIALALEKNYDVQISRKASESAGVDNAFVWGAFVPQINAVAGTVWNANDQQLRFQDASRDNSGRAESNNRNASLQLNWTLFDGTRMFATQERIGVIAEQGELLVKDQMVNTIAATIATYYDIVRQKQQLKAILEQMSVSEERVKIAERKLDVGTGVKPELLQARVDYNAQRTQVIQQESIIQQLKLQLNAMVGEQLPATYEVADTILINLELDPEDIGESVENSNFGLMALRQNVRAANLSVHERRAEYFPILNFNAAYNYAQTDNTRQINPFSPVFNQQQGYNYGFTLNIPILNGFNTRRLTQLAKIEADRQSLLYSQAKTNVNTALRNAYINYDNARRILLIEEENIGLARENVFIALEAFKRGVTTFIELRTAQQSLEVAYNSLIAARYNAKLAETELLRLSGRLLR